MASYNGFPESEGRDVYCPSKAAIPVQLTQRMMTVELLGWLLAALQGLCGKDLSEFHECQASEI